MGSAGVVCWSLCVGPPCEAWTPCVPVGPPCPLFFSVSFFSRRQNLRKQQAAKWNRVGDHKAMFELVLGLPIDSGLPSGPPMDPVWTPSGTLLVPLRTPFGPLWTPLWTHLWIPSGPPLSPLWTPIDSLWTPSRAWARSGRPPSACGSLNYSRSRGA